jgi:hypothetical protein
MHELLFEHIYVIYLRFLSDEDWTNVKQSSKTNHNVWNLNWLKKNIYQKGEDWDPIHRFNPAIFVPVPSYDMNS